MNAGRAAGAAGNPGGAVPGGRAALDGQCEGGAAGAPARRLAGLRQAGRGWLLIRVSGLLLSVLVLGHLLAVHLVTDVARTTASYVARRWDAALWVGWDGCMLTAALAHGAAGVSVVVRDHLPPGRGRAAALVVLWLAVAALAALGWYTIAAAVRAAA